MELIGRCIVVLSVVILWNCALALQRPPPRYSQQYMPETSFTCRNKIVGSYYADPETDCQVFHVCVSVAGSVQDYKFLCPNDTAFDQESQTCADWYDVDCEAATLYYASDNFDLYRIGSGLESLHYDNLRTDAEPQDHLQRSETSDPVRSSANTLNRVSSGGYSANGSAGKANGNGNRDVLRGSSSSGFYNRNNGGEDDYESDKAYKEEPVPEAKKKPGVRKVSRKQQYTGDNAGSYSPSSTAAPALNAQNAYTGNYYSSSSSGSNNNNAYNRPTTAYASSTTARPLPQENGYNRNQNSQRYNGSPSSTYRPSTGYQDSYGNSYQSPSTTGRTTVYNAYKANGNYNQQNGAAFAQSTTTRPTSYAANGNNNYNSNSNNNNNNNNYNNNNNGNNKNNYQAYNSGQYTQSTTVQPSTNYQPSDYTNYQQRSYNNIQRGSSPAALFQPSSSAPTVYDNSYSGNYNGNGNGNGNNQYRAANGGSTRQEVAQTTAKYFPSLAGSSYAPTTYSPATRKFVTGDNSPAQTAPRGSDRYANGQVEDDGRYYEKNGQPAKPSTRYYDSTKAPKKATQYTGYDNGNTGKYYAETSTGSYDIARSPAGIGFSPASINHLAETPRSTTPVPRRPAIATTYNPSSFNSNTQRAAQSPTTPRGSTYVSGSARPFSSTAIVASSTTPRPKGGKKNDYDYAYYDNAGPLEYDGLDLEHVTGNKESTKIARN